MSAISEQLLIQTIEFWQPVASRPLTQEDARQITENVRGFFDLLNGWAVNDTKGSRPEAEMNGGGIKS